MNILNRMSVAALGLAVVVVACGPAVAVNQPRVELQYASKTNGQCLTVVDVADAAPTVALRPCDGMSKAQKWERRAAGVTGRVKLYNPSKDACLGLLDKPRLIECSLPGAALALNDFGWHSQIVFYQDQSPAGCLKADLSNASCASGSAVPDAQLWTRQSFGQKTPSGSSREDTKAAFAGPQQMGFVPVSAGHTPSGNVFMWGGKNSTSPVFVAPVGESNTHTAIYDPKLGVEFAKIQGAAQFILSGHAMSRTGSLIIAGGYPATKEAVALRAQGKLETIGKLKNPVTANTLVTLANGNILSLGGSSGARPFIAAEIRRNDVWQSLSGITPKSAMTLLSGDPVTRRGFNNLWVFASGNGDYAFHAGPGKDMHWTQTAGSGNISKVATRAASVQAGAAVMYEPGKILVTGGANLPRDAAKKSVELIDLKSASATGGAPAVTTMQMVHARAHHNAVVLANGEVLIIGGSTFNDVHNDRHAVTQPEIWNPATKEFRELAVSAGSSIVPRVLNSWAMLLPDATVLVGGGGNCGTQCARFGGSNHTNVQVFKPPYLLEANGSDVRSRPVIESVGRSVLNDGEQIVITMRDVAPVSFAIARMSSTRQGVNSDQRWISLTSEVFRSKQHLVTFPTTSAGAIPGRYMLFALDAKGVPSIAKIVELK